MRSRVSLSRSVIDPSTLSTPKISEIMPDELTARMTEEKPINSSFADPSTQTRTSHFIAESKFPFYSSPHSHQIYTPIRGVVKLRYRKHTRIQDRRLQRRFQLFHKQS